MSLTLIEAPSVEPIGLAEAKAHLRVDGPDEDDLIAALITAARLHIEAAAEIALITQTWRLACDGWPPSGRLVLPIGPVSAIAEVRLYDAAGGSDVLAADRYRLSGGLRPAVVSDGAGWAAPTRALDGIAITFQAGYGADGATVPAPLRHAVKLLVAHFFEAREPVSLDAGATDVPLTIAALIVPYRAMRI